MCLHIAVRSEVDEPAPVLSPRAQSVDADWIVIGSGFGGSVAALRLAEKGYRVTVIEQGRRFADGDFARSAWQLRRLLWRPALGLRGIMQLTPFAHMTVLSGVGVGGGSLVYGNTLYVPHSDEFYRHEQWGDLADWRAVLAPHYATAKRMLGVTTFQGGGASERLMDQIARDLGVSDTRHPTDVGVYFGEPGAPAADPYFGGTGPARVGCTRCGQCMLGCRVGAKNTLTKNYLALAERLGVRIVPDTVVERIAPAGAADGSEGYELTIRRSGALPWHRRRTLHAQGIVVAAGALGTAQLLRACKDGGSLPALSIASAIWFAPTVRRSPRSPRRAPPISRATSRSPPACTQTPTRTSPTTPTAAVATRWDSPMAR